MSLWAAGSPWRSGQREGSMPMRIEKDGAGTGQARGATEACSDEKADLGGYKGRGSQETETALLREGCSETQHVCMCWGGTCVYGHEWSSVH